MSQLRARGVGESTGKVRKTAQEQGLVQDVDILSCRLVQHSSLGEEAVKENHGNFTLSRNFSFRGTLSFE